MPRNRELMRVYKDLKFVEQLGSGVRRILKVYNENNFIMSDNFLEITFPFYNDFHKESSQKSSQKIIELIDKNKFITTEEMAENIGINRRSITKQISKLKKEGVVERIGPDKGGYWNIIK